MKDKPELSSASIFGIKLEDTLDKFKYSAASTNIRNDPQYKAMLVKIDIEAETCPIIEDVLLCKRPNIF